MPIFESPVTFFVDENGIGKTTFIEAIAVGPMCLMVFNTAKNIGLLVAMSLVLAIALINKYFYTRISIDFIKSNNDSFLGKCINYKNYRR